jgi:hypothetical protein
MLAAQSTRLSTSAARAARPSAGPAPCPISGRAGARPALLRRRRRDRDLAPRAAGDDDDAARAGPSPSSGDDDLARLLKADMERFASTQQQTVGGTRATTAAAQNNNNNSSSSSNNSNSSNNEEGGVKAALDRLLVADFFAVVAALAWLGAGLAERAALGSSRLVDAWMPLWPLLWQPLIGVLMAGALVSGGAGWLASKREEGRRQQEEQGQGQRRR